jgi:membrane protein DedA with SNARE-associated domain
VLAALVGGGFGLPFPEDLALLSAGYLAWRGDAPPVLLAPLALGAMVSSDLVLFTFGRQPWLARRVMKSSLGGPFFERMLDGFRVRARRLILLARVAIGLRAPFFVAAGLAGVPLRRFLLWDALGGAVMVVAWMAVGFAVGAKLERVRAIVGRADLAIFAVVLIVALVALWRNYTRRQALTGERRVT